MVFKLELNIDVLTEKRTPDFDTFYYLMKNQESIELGGLLDKLNLLDSDVRISELRTESGLSNDLNIPKLIIKVTDNNNLP